MKLFSVVFLLLLSSSVYAQFGSSAIKLGFFSPSAAQGGFIIGYEGGKEIDQYFFFGWSIDWFRKSYVDKKLVDDYNASFGSGGEINELRAKTNIHDFPVMVSASGKFPVAPRVSVYINGGIGAEMLLINYRNFDNPDKDEFRAAFDFNWRVGFGSAYELGTYSEIFGEVTYHNSAPSWEYEVDAPLGESSFFFRDKRTFERIFDMSGVMGRIGLRFYY
jgi:hypothetical protein